MPFAVTGSNNFSIRSRIQAPAALNSRLLLPLRRASATTRSVRAATMLAATEELKAMMEAPKDRRVGAKRPARAP